MNYAQTEVGERKAARREGERECGKVEMKKGDREKGKMGDGKGRRKERGSEEEG